MPNRRSKDKVFLGGFIQRSLKRRLVALAKEAGMDTNVFGFVISLIQPTVKRRAKRLKQKRVG